MKRDGQTKDNKLNPLAAIFRSQHSAIEEPKLPASVYVSSAFINVLGLALPLTILHVYDRVLPNQAFNTLTMLVFGLITAVILDTVLKIARGEIMGWRAASFAHRQSVDAMARLMSAKASAVQSARASSTISQLRVLTEMADFHGSSARLMLIDIAWAPVFAIVITVIAGPLIAVPIVFLLGFIAYISTQTRQLRKIIDEREAIEERKYDFMLETLQTMQTVKSLAMEPLMMRRFERLQSASSHGLQKNVHASQTIGQAGGLFVLLMTMAVVFFGALMVINNALTIGALAACMLLSSQMMQPIMRSIQAWSAIIQNDHRRAEVEKLYEHIAHHPAHIPPVVRHQPQFEPAAIHIRDLAVGGDDRPVVFQNVTAHIKPGAFIGVKGADGSGRSVLLRCVMGEITPRDGLVLVGDSVAGQSEARISYVGQVPQLFHGTILDNLTLFGTYTAEDARWAAELTGLSGEINRLPDGFDTPLHGSASPELSAAFSQLICVARAIVSKPSVLLLDASNSGLDAKTETAFMNMLQRLKGKMTILLVTPRPSMLRTADQVLELSENTGRLVSPSDALSPFGAVTEKAS